MTRARMRATATAGPVRRALLAALSAVVASTTILAGVLGAAGAASAADGDSPIELSSDGVVWSVFLNGGFFDDFQGAVPGDASTRSFFVRNPQAFPITMKTRALDVVSSTTGLAGSLMVQGEAGGVSLAEPVPLSSLADCATLAPDLVLEANATTKVSITMTLPVTTRGQTAQTSRGGFDVLLTMQDNAAGTPDASCDTGGGTGGGGGGDGGGGDGGGGDGGGGSHGGGGHHSDSPPVQTAAGPTNPLAFTGIDGAATLFLGGALVALGFLFLGARRRRRTDRQEQ